MNEEGEFLKDLPKEEEEDAFAKKPEDTGTTPEQGEEKEGAVNEKLLTNRYARRMAQRYQAEREANIALNARLQAISEAKETSQSPSVEEDFLKIIEPIYGNATPEGKTATELLKQGLKKVYEKAAERAEQVKSDTIREYEERQSRESQAVAEEEDAIEEGLESIEEEYGADLSDSDTRRGFLTLLERMSPKDRDGNIVEYADFGATWEMFEATREKGSSRAKELAGRSMTRSGSSQPSKLEKDSMERFLRDNGII